MWSCTSWSTSEAHWMLAVTERMEEGLLRPESRGEAAVAFVLKACVGKVPETSY
jgi:hypothetical protein